MVGMGVKENLKKCFQKNGLVVRKMPVFSDVIFELRQMHQFINWKIFKKS